MTRLKVEDISVKLGDKVVLGNVSFHVDQGELVGLIGPNGAGKTTLIRTLTGLQTVECGVVRLDDQPLARIDRRALARAVAYLPNGAPCHWPITVRQVVALGRLPHARGWRDRDQADNDAIADAMTATDVSHLCDRKVSALSSGERVRVLLARAIAAEPDILLADEPTTSLDPFHQLHVMELLRERATGGEGVVAVMHDLSLAARFCHRIVLIQDGRLVANGAPADVLTADNIRSAYGVEAQFGEIDGELYLVPWDRLASAPAVAPDLSGVA
ncbi:MAG: ABC transporter ATP-binding protein [Sphingomonadales bacterium]